MKMVYVNRLMLTVLLRSIVDVNKQNGSQHFKSVNTNQEHKFS